MPIDSRPTLFCLHALGSSAREFDGLAARLDPDLRVVAIDLPGFGDATTAAGTTVEDMRTAVLERIRAHGATRWMIAGHSMGGKVATAVAATVLAGAPGVFGLAGVVLLAASPPAPEPMDDDRRADMLGWARDADGALTPLDAEAARTFIDGNVGAPLDATDDAAAVADVRRASPEAWTAWLTRGSREDWRPRVGTLDLPALVIAGGADGDLGPEAQRSLNGAVYPRARFAVLDGAGHMLPLERTDEVAAAIRSFWDEHAGTAPLIPEDVVGTIASDRTSARTRAVMARRALADDPGYAPRVLSPAQLDALRALADRVVPQTLPDAAGAPANRPIDIAARVDAQLAAGQGDGWRNAALPVDTEAYRIGLDALDGFADLGPDEQDARITAIVDGSYDPATAGGFDADRLSLWFEDARVDLVRQWLAHPATMARIGFDGYANGGDGTRLQGFQLLGADEREGWEPTMEVTR